RAAGRVTLILSTTTSEGIHMKRLLATLSVLLTASVALGQTAPTQVALSINADKVIKPVDVLLYGHFLEHIYHSAHGGLWGELVWNRSFEEGPPAPAGARGRGRGTTTSAPASAPAATATAPATTTAAF